MAIILRPAQPADFGFALSLYVETNKALVAAWADWVDEEQEAQFASLWSPQDTWIIALDGEDIGWVEFRRTGNEIFRKQLYITPSRQRHGIGSRVVRLLDEHGSPAESMALFVLMNNPAFRFYERHGFEVIHETHSTFVMRRAMAEVA
jgi:ribosomal protein S18 acetylase RimI-like enzyme